MASPKPFAFSHVLLLMLGLGIAVEGCGGEYEGSNEIRRAAMNQDFSQEPSAAEGVEGKENVALPEKASETDSVARKRRIVYRSEVDLVVEQFDPIPADIEKDVALCAGFIASSNISGSPGQPRTGRWVARIPVEQHTKFLNTIREMGEVRSIGTTSSDVTAEYYDVDSRIRNKRLEEERMLQLLSEGTGKLEEVLAVERELSRVRGEIEQALGRMRVLSDLTELTTVTITVHEIHNYVPEDNPTYLTQVKRTFSGSTINLITAAKDVSLGIVALVPWLVVPLFLLLVVFGVRRFRKAST